MDIGARRLARWGAGGLLLLSGLAGCGAPAPATVRPTPRATPVTATPRPADTGWQTLSAGLEYRELAVAGAEATAAGGRWWLARIDPAQMRVRVRYDPAQPRYVSEWLRTEGAWLAVNGGYFDPQQRAVGLLIVEGQVYGQPYEGFGGMLTIVGREVRVRWNVAEPYQPGEALTYAVQNFPMLVLPGGAANTIIDDNGARAARTMVGQDRAGRIIWGVCPASVFSLTELSAWLAASDLDLEIALNLDGGPSSGMLVQLGAQPWGVDSWVPVPEAIVVAAP